MRSVESCSPIRWTLQSARSARSCRLLGLEVCRCRALWSDELRGPSDLRASRILQPDGSCNQSGPAASRIMQPVGSCSQSDHAASRVLQPVGSCSQSGPVVSRVMWTVFCFFLWNACSHLFQVVFQCLLSKQSIQLARSRCGRSLLFASIIILSMLSGHWSLSVFHD